MTNNIARIKELVNLLGKYDKAYYQTDSDLISDSEYDKLYFELKELEEKTGLILNSSPTQRVGFEAQSGLNKVTHDHLMLSLDKSKDIKDIVKFCKGNKSDTPITFASAKEDGLTCFLYYDSYGYLTKAETRGNGKVGEDITENVKQIGNVPFHINNNGNPLKVEGEIIVKKDIFEKINSVLSANEKFSKPRNYASGSVRQLNTEVTKQRQLSFIAWKNLSEKTSFTSGLYELVALGFEVVPLFVLGEIDNSEVSKAIRFIQTTCNELEHPIDGVVFTYDDVEYGEKLGNTSHHYRHSYAFKFEDDEYETKLLNIEWNIGKSGMFAPTAIFEEVEIDGSKINKASISNLTIIKEILGKPYVGQKIWIRLSNMIIPQIVRSEKCQNVKI